MVSTGVADAFGAIGGGVLAACLIPQLWKLLRTRSAADINLAFLLTYLFGLAVSVVYLYYEDAVVAWACILVEIACVLLMVAGKVYLDRWGPYSRRALRRARPEAALTSSTSFADKVGLSVKDAGSAFAQLLQPEPSHAAQHLLLDARLALPPTDQQQPVQQRGDTPTASPDSQAVPADEPASSSGGGSSSKAGASADGAAGQGGSAGQPGDSGVLSAVADMAATALAGAGMPALCRQAQAFPSFRQRLAAGAADAAAEAEAATSTDPPDMLFLAYRGGYASIVWHPASATLSLDLLVASDVAAARAARAAQELCEQLVARWPGSRIEASSVARLPRQQAVSTELPPPMSAALVAA
ncbi:hypothetical protein ABPG75_011385 [Micractinium tetrahymenae]